MEFTITLLEDFITSMDTYNNLGVYSELSFTNLEDEANIQLVVTNFPQAFSITVSFEYIDDENIMICDIEFSGSAQCLKFQETSSASQFLDDLQAISVYLSPTVPCVFCGEHFIGFTTQVVQDPYLRTLAVLKILGLDITQVRSLLLLESIFPHKKGPIFYLKRPDSFIILDIVRPPQICDGALKQASSGNQCSHESQTLKKSLKVEEVGGRYQEIGGPVDRDFMDLAAGNNKELYCRKEIFLFHEKCKCTYKTQITPIKQEIQVNLNDENTFIQAVVQKSLQMQTDNRAQTAKDATDFMETKSATTATVYTDIQRQQQPQKIDNQPQPLDMNQYRVQCYLNSQQPKSLRFDMKQTFLRYREQYGPQAGRKFEEEQLSTPEGLQFIKYLNDYYLKSTKK